MAPKSKIITLPVGELKIHPTAQRRVVPMQIKKRMATLDLDAIGVLQGVKKDAAGQYLGLDVHANDGTVYIIDGQHRVLALMQHGFDEWRVKVEIHECDSDARASELFLRFNARSTVSAYDTFENEVEACFDTAVGVVKVAKRYGLKVDRQSGDGHVACVTTLKSIYEIDEGVTLNDSLEILSTAYGRVASAYEGKLPEGLAIVVSKNNGNINTPTLVKKLSKYPGGASGILGDAKGLKKIRRSSVGRCVAETIVEAYNMGRRDVHRLPLP
jgi:hypothetical protein